MNLAPQPLPEYAAIDITTLAIQARAGDRIAIEQTYVRTLNTLGAFILSCTKDQSLTEEIALTATEKVMTKGIFADESEEIEFTNFNAWSKTVALNMVRDHFRKTYRRKTDLFDDISVLERNTNLQVTDPEYTEQPIATILDQVSISDDTRKILMLRFDQDLSSDQIAEIMGVASGTIKSRIHRGLAMVRKHYHITPGETPYRDVLGYVDDSVNVA